MNELKTHYDAYIIFGLKLISCNKEIAWSIYCVAILK